LNQILSGFFPLCLANISDFFPFNPWPNAIALT
jgi:hypothetical protein